LGEANLDEAFLETDVALFLAETEGMLAELLEFVLPIKSGQIILVRAVEPFGDVIGIEADAVFGHFLDYLFISLILAKEFVDQSTEFSGELSDLALGTAAAARFKGRGH